MVDVASSGPDKYNKYQDILAWGTYNLDFFSPVMFKLRLFTYCVLQITTITIQGLTNCKHYILWFISLSPIGLQEGLVYWDWEHYSSLFTTYEMDKDYVNFVNEVSSKLKVCIIARSYW